jgi:hypothetical protein
MMMMMKSSKRFTHSKFLKHFTSLGRVMVMVMVMVRVSLFTSMTVFLKMEVSGRFIPGQRTLATYVWGRKLGDPQCQCWRFGEEKYPTLLSKTRNPGKANW